MACMNWPSPACSVSSLAWCRACDSSDPWLWIERHSCRPSVIVTSVTSVQGASSRGPSSRSLSSVLTWRLARTLHVGNYLDRPDTVQASPSWLPFSVSSGSSYWPSFHQKGSDAPTSQCCPRTNCNLTLRCHFRRSERLQCLSARR